MSDKDNATDADGLLKLDTLQRDILIPQIQAFLEATSDPAAREVYLALKAAVEKMEVAADLQPRLGAIVELALSSGRVRRLFGPGAELSVNALFQKTPRGREIAKSIGDVNSAMSQLNGQSIESIAASIKGPGAYALTVKTGQCQIVVRFEQSGLRIESLEVDLA